MHSSTLKPLLLALGAVSWIGTASANIDFVNFAANLTVNPGDTLTLRWTSAPADNGTVADLGNFNLVLRALTGQKYNIQNNISQALGTIEAQVPKTATGGKHSFYADYLSLPKGTSTNQFTVNGAIVTTTAASSTPTGGSSTADTGISAGALAGIIAGAVVLLIVVALIFFCRHRRRAAVANVSSRSMDDKDQDKESLTKSAGSAGGLGDGGMVNIPINGGPAPRRPDETPRMQQRQQEDAMQRPISPVMQRPISPARNPFEGPGSSPRLNQNQQFQYQPPQPYPGNSNPAMGAMNDNRESFESELESAYDPKRPSRMLTNGGSHFINSRGPTGASPLSHSASTGSTNSSRYPRNKQTQNQSQNPFGQDDQETLAMAAAAATASPLLANKQMSPAKMKEIEMQPLDIQQHHLEQQQKMLQRQQQQQQQQQEAQESVQPKAPAPIPAAQQSINPTQFDDKAEVEEDTTVYNGYRDTIFGHYAPQQGDEDDEEETPVPALPTLPVVASQQPEQPSANVVQRKKSVKFTGVPVSGPIVLPNHEAAKEHQAQRQQRQHQDQPRPLSEVVTDDVDAYFNDDEDEDDVKNRLMRSEALSTASPISESRPQINTNINSSEASALSPVYSPEQSSPSHNIGGYVPPPPAVVDDSSDSFFGNGFYEDVLAAVEKSTTDTPEPPSSTKVTSPVAQKPVMPPVPSSPVEHVLPQQAVQQQYIPAPQPQHLQPVNQEVFGAPSPRIAPAAAAKTQVLPLSPRTNTRPAELPTVHHEDDDDDQEFYDNSIL